MASTELNVTSFDHQALKDALIVYLKSTGKFDDFNFDGSAINTIIDLLSNNSEMTAFMANMIANESFIQSAQIRSNVVSHAEKLSYHARTATCARIICDITVSPVQAINLLPTITLPVGGKFYSTVGNITYSFTNIDDILFQFDAPSNTYVARGVTLYQGAFVTNSYVYTSGSKIVIPNIGLDSSTIRVTVSTASGVQSYNYVSTVSDLLNSTNAFFLTENTLKQQEISFGGNVISNEPDNNSTVTVQYVVTESNLANGLSKLTCGSSIGGFSNIAVTVSTPAFGGAQEEDIESIRMTAPRYYASQDRAVNTSDFVSLLKSKFSYIKSVISWGGEDNVPVSWGNVFLCVLTTFGDSTPESLKLEMIDFLKDKMIGSVTPVITDPDRVYLQLQIAFKYDSSKTLNSSDVVSSNLINAAYQYSTSQLEDFNEFYNDAVLNGILIAIPGVSTEVISKTAYKNIQPVSTINPTYDTSFNNPVSPGSLLMTGFVTDIDSTVEVLKDDSKGNLTIWTTIGGQTTNRNVGTVDYSTGTCSFSMNMIQPSMDPLRLYAVPSNTNFYTVRNMIISIDDVRTSQL